jgi:hypothetical protein
MTQLELEREWRSPPTMPPPRGDIVLPEPPKEPVPLECPYPDDDYNDVDEYNDLIVH